MAQLFSLGRLYDPMKSTFFVVSVVAVVLAGCSHQDPIDSIVKKASAGPCFPPVSDILTFSFKLPATAPVAEVVSKALHNETNITILETKQVDIANNANKLRFGHSDIQSYTAVLVNTSSGKKVVFLHFYPLAGDWDYVTYDLPPSA